MLRIGETGYAVRTNGVTVASAPEEDATLREPPLLQLYAPEAVFSHGYRGALSASLLADRPTTGTLTLTVSGGEHISLWTAYSGGSEVSLPKTFDAETFGGVTTSATIVLPLAGAEISADIEGLFAYADGFVSSVSNSYAFISSETSLEGLLHEVFIGFYWFGSAWNGYFTGRPDAFSPRHQTVRWYNQVNDDNGRGAIATLYGCPIYLEKMSNLFAAYACEKLGVDAWKQEISQDYGTPNDYAAIASWQTGVSLAHLDAGQIETKLRALALGSWRNTEANEPKLRNLWPNPANAVNFCGKNENDNFDTEYYAPGFLYLGGNDHE